MKIMYLRNKRIIFAILIFLALVISIIFLIHHIAVKRAGMEGIFAGTEKQNANLTEYVIYGTHLNLKGQINDNISEIKSVNLIFRDIDGNTEKMPLKFEENEAGVYFYTSNLINDGINLEKIKICKYYLLVEVKYKSFGNKTYSISNDTKYENALYYTITRDKSNNKIEIGFDAYKAENKYTNYMFIETKKAKLPKDVYDIVIDAGHRTELTQGHSICGYKEADLNLEYAKKLKVELEKLGLKIKLTRDGTEDEESLGTSTVYKKDGRINIIGRSKAKYVISIHQNSINEANSEHGVEVYVAARTNLDYAKLFADNIVKYAKTDYSTLYASYKSEKRSLC